MTRLPAAKSLGGDGSVRLRRPTPRPRRVRISNARCTCAAVMRAHSHRASIVFGSLSRWAASALASALSGSWWAGGPGGSVAGPGVERRGGDSGGSSDSEGDRWGRSWSIALATSSTGMAPWTRISAAPRVCGSNGDPGTTNTGRPTRRALAAACVEPLGARRACTTTVARVRATSTRLRRWNVHRNGWVSSSRTDSSAPCAAMERNNGSCCLG
jgi:hypothetical protein